MNQLLYSKLGSLIKVEPSLATSIGQIQLDRPVMLASGILGISLDVFNRLYRSGAGAVVTKSLSTEPWEGYPNPTIFSVKGGGWINAVGLSNPGAPNFAKMIEPNQDVPIIVSLVGSIPEDFEMMIKQFENCKVIAYELNLSCPHVAKVGLEVGDDPELVKKIVTIVKNSTNIPVIAKVGLGTTHYLNTVSTAIDSGIDAITAINTVRAMAINVETKRPILSNKFGGLSGTPIKPIALRCVYEISSKYDIPIIGCGGISTWEDAVEFFLAGASAIQLGSAIGDNWIDIFNDLNNGIISYMKRNGFSKIEDMVGLAKNYNHPTIVTIEKVIDETPTVRTLVFSDEVISNVLPGQFAMVWIPGVNELPMSIMISNESGKAAFTVRKHGLASTGLFNVKVGEQIGIRGPYGNSFDLKEGKLLLVGGGTGLVPMMRLLTFVKSTDDVTVLIGAKSKDEVFFEDLANNLLKNNSHKVIVSTDDGSYGKEGFVTDSVEKLVNQTHFDAVYVCGPEIMMYKTVQSAHSKGIFVQASLERMMKCGVGICGSCCVGEDLVCKDGTIFDGEHLLVNKEFGHVHRNKAGILENY